MFCSEEFVNKLNENKNLIRNCEDIPSISEILWPMVGYDTSDFKSEFMKQFYASLYLWIQHLNKKPEIQAQYFEFIRLIIRSMYQYEDKLKKESLKNDIKSLIEKSKFSSVISEQISTMIEE